MAIKQKLELTWIGKDTPIKAEPRILVHDPSKDYGDKNTDNMLIYGDNLLALKALEQEYAGKVKCIYIDPPYNTGSAFEHYDDNLEHSTWLSLMKPRLEILRNLLADDGVIFVQIDDNEQAYLRVLMDEVFGRSNFLATFIWAGRAGKAGTISSVSFQHEYIHSYGKTSSVCLKKEIRYTDGGNFTDEVGNYKREQLRQWGQADRREDRPSMYFPIQAPDGSEIFPYKEDGTEGRWRVSLEKFKQLQKENLIDIVKVENKWRVYRKIRDGRKTEIAYGTLLLNTGTSATGTLELKGIFGEKSFDTPKPELLISHLIHLSSNVNDLVLDSFLGSGTTAAVAHKMGRKYIGIELGEHCHTHCIPRLQKVIDGTDQGGISKAVGWKGGGGFKYYYLAPSLLNKDKYGQYVISKEYNADMLAAAMAKHEGFLYAPDQDQFWKQGKSSENDYIYTTTNHVGEQALSAISDDMKDGESLLICCKSFDAGVANGYSNITVKKIPGAILGSCEFGKDNYNLNIINPPVIDDEEE